MLSAAYKTCFVLAQKPESGLLVAYCTLQASRPDTCPGLFHPHDPNPSSTCQLSAMCRKYAAHYDIHPCQIRSHVLLPHSRARPDMFKMVLRDRGGASFGPHVNAGFSCKLSTTATNFRAASLAASIPVAPVTTTFPDANKRPVAFGSRILITCPRRWAQSNVKRDPIYGKKYVRFLRFFTLRVVHSSSSSVR